MQNTNSFPLSSKHRPHICDRTSLPQCDAEHPHRNGTYRDHKDNYHLRNKTTKSKNLIFPLLSSPAVHLINLNGTTSILDNQFTTTTQCFLLWGGQLLGLEPETAQVGETFITARPAVMQFIVFVESMLFRRRFLFHISTSTIAIC